MAGKGPQTSLIGTAENGNLQLFDNKNGNTDFPDTNYDQHAKLNRGEAKCGHLKNPDNLVMAKSFKSTLSTKIKRSGEEAESIMTKIMDEK